MPFSSRYAHGVPKGTNWYENVILSMRKRAPSLVNLQPFFPGVTTLPGTMYIDRHNDKCRAVVIDVSKPDHSPIPFHVFENCQELSSHLAQATNQASGHRRVYILENLSLEYIVAFGSHFLIDPSLFVNQRRTVNWEGQPGEGNVPKLLSCTNREKSFSLRYSELLDFENVSSVNEMEDIAAGRRVGFTNLDGKVNSVGIARRKISFWSRDTKNNGWDGKQPS